MIRYTQIAVSTQNIGSVGLPVSLLQTPLFVPFHTGYKNIPMLPHVWKNKILAVTSSKIDFVDGNLLFKSMFITTHINYTGKTVHFVVDCYYFIL